MSYHISVCFPWPTHLDWGVEGGESVRGGPDACFPSGSEMAACA